MILNKNVLPYIKVCGITNVEDALLAVKLGANALGFIFDRNSPRFVTAEQAGAIIAVLPPFITTVGVFVNLSFAEVMAILNQAPLQVLQFHGDETEADCKQYRKPYVKAFRIKADSNIIEFIDQYPSASAFLLDTYSAQQYGGTGVAFNWQQIPKNCTKPIILAGGLTSANVAQAIQEVKPYAVDVNSGVEIQPGRKDPDKLIAFFNEVRYAYEAKN